MASPEEILKKLKSKARPDQIEGMTKYGMGGANRLGVTIPDLRMMAKEIGKDHELALNLWGSGIPDAMILAAMVDCSEKVTEQQMEDWVKDIGSWDVCDQLCMNLFKKVPFVLKKISEWSERKEEFVKRTAFALIACLAWHDKQAPDELFIQFFPIIKKGSTDGRNFVKKAVSWGLRNIGKRNPTLNKAAIKTAKEILQIDSKAARWIASNVIRELESNAVQRRLKSKVAAIKQAK
jgi:3-methyladenine DNA glycosylase AlkD